MSNDLLSMVQAARLSDVILVHPDTLANHRPDFRAAIPDERLIISRLVPPGLVFAAPPAMVRTYLDDAARWLDTPAPPIETNYHTSVWN